MATKRKVKGKAKAKPSQDVIAQAIAFLASKGMATTFPKTQGVTHDAPSKTTTHDYYMRPHSITKSGKPTYWWCQVLATNDERTYWDRMMAILGFPTQGAFVLSLLIEKEKQMVKDKKIEMLKRK